MAKQTGTAITGTFGSDIYYQWKDIYCVRSKGNTGRQAPVAKKQASLLGKASAVSAKLRAALKPLIADPASRATMYRFNNAMQRWLRIEQVNIPGPINELPFISGFSFNENNGNDLQVAMPVSRTADGQIALQIPAFDSPNPVSPLPFNGQIRLHIIAASCRLDDPSDTRSYETVLDISYTGIPIPAQELVLPLQALPGYITVTGLSVNGLTSGIVGAMYN
jgi:hypothetical protein